MKFRYAGETDVLVDITNLDAIETVKEKYLKKSGKASTI